MMLGERLEGSTSSSRRSDSSDRAVDIEHADELPSSFISGITSSDRDALSHAMWPGNSSTFGTRNVTRRSAAVPQTPRPSGIRTHAGCP